MGCADPWGKKSFLSPVLPGSGHSGGIAIARSDRASKDARLSTGYGDAAIQQSWGVQRSNGLLRCAGKLTVTSRFIRRPGQCTTTSDFRKEKSFAPPQEAVRTHRPGFRLLNFAASCSAPFASRPMSEPTAAK